MAYQKKSYKKFVATAASATLVASAIVPVVSAASFSDVAETHEFATYIDAAVEAGYIKGYTDGTFGVNDNLKRSQVVIIIGRYLESLGYESEETTSPWSDVTNEEVIKYGNIVKDAGVFTGYADGTLNGNAFITRENMAVVLDRLAETVTGISLSDVAEEIEDVEIADLATANADYQASIQALRDLEISTADNFNPKGNVKRGQFAKFIVTAVETINAIAEEVTELKVESVTAVNGTITVTLEEAYEEVYVENFTVTQAINGGEAKEVTPSKAELSEDGTTVTLTVDQVAQADAAQSVVYTVNGVAAEAFVVESVAKELKVESVSAINAKQIVVKFSKEVYKNSVVDANGKLLSNVVFLDGADLSGKSAKLTDKNELVITLTSALTKDNEYAVVVDNVLDVNAKKAPKYASAFKANETVAPAIASITSVTKEEKTNNVIVEFTEPVSFNSIKVNDKFVAATPIDNGFGAKYSLTTTDQLEAGSTYKVEINGLKDGFGNAAENILTSSVTVVRDTVKPKYTVEAVGENKFKVVFDKEMDPSVAVDSFTVTKVDALGNTVTIPQTGLAVRLSDKKTFLVSVNQSLVFDNSTQNTKEVSIAVKGLKDSFGNVMDSKTEKITLTRDLVKPTIKAVKQVPGSQTQVEIEFSEYVSSIDKTDFHLTDADGKEVRVNNTQIIPSAVSSSSTDTNNKVIVTFSGALPQSGTYKLVLEQDAVQDASLAANKNAAQVVSFNYTKQATQVTQLTANITGTTNGSTPVDSTKENRKVHITFNEPVVNGIDNSTGTYKDGAANNPANYTVNGLALPTGTTVSYDPVKNSVVLDFSNVLDKDLPSALSQGGSVAVAVSNVKSVAGSTLAYTTKAVAVVDKTKPTIKAAYVQGNEVVGYTITLTASEALGAVAVEDFGYVVTSPNITELSSTDNTATIDSNDATKVVITVKNSTDVASLKGLLDTNGNTVVFGVTDADDAAGTADKAGNKAAKGVVGTNTVTLQEFLTVGPVLANAAAVADAGGQVAKITVTKASVPTGTAKVAHVVQSGGTYTSLDIPTVIDDTVKSNATAIDAGDTTVINTSALTAADYSILVAYLDASGNVIGYEIKSVTLV